MMVDREVLVDNEFYAKLKLYLKPTERLLTSAETGYGICLLVPLVDRSQHEPCWTRLVFRPMRVLP